MRIWAGGCLPLAVNVYLYTSVDTVLLLVASKALIAVVLCDADILTPVVLTRTVAVFFGDADVFAVAVVSTGRRAGLRVVSLTSIFPSSAFNSYSLVSLDFGGRLLILVC